MTPIRRFRLLVCLLSICASLVVRAEVQQRHDEYRITLDPQLNNLQVNACFNSRRPNVLLAGSDYAADLLLNASIKQNRSEKRLVVTASAIKVSQLTSDGCLTYTVNFKQIRSIKKDSRLNVQLGNTIGMMAGHWLWLPENASRPIQLRFYLPKGILVSTPWRLIKRTDQFTLFQIDPVDNVEESQIYFGDFTLRDIDVSGARIRLVILGNPTAVEKDKLTIWIRYGTESIVALYGYYPLPNPQIVVFPIGPFQSAVPWGDVQRDGGCVANLYVDQTRSLSELIADWTLIHELSHMIHPYINMDGRWLSEGIATYYQNVLQARVNTLTEARAWTKLHEGFQRGIKETEAGKPLIDVSNQVRQNQKFMRVYWSGVALALKADWTLRKEGKGSLDEVMAGFQQCCLQPNRTWTPNEYMNKLDELSGRKIFTTLYQEYAYSDQFPDLNDVYSSLGFIPKKNKLEFIDEAEGIMIRKSIMQRVY
jgi:predicted metalloprotease with PDZ domain